MKIEEFISVLDSFTKVWMDFGFPKVDTSNLPFFQKTNAYSKYSKAEFSNESININIGHTEYGVVHLAIDEEMVDKFDKDTMDISQYSTRKLFVDGKPIKDIFNIVCPADELYKVKRTDIYVDDEEMVGDDALAPNCKVVCIDLTKVTFDHFKREQPDYETAASLAIKLTKLKANAKVINWFDDKYSPKTDDNRTLQLEHKYDPDVVRILKANRINDFGYQPAPYYYKKSTPIKIKVSGMSNLPKVEDVMDRIASNKAQTSAGKLMKPTVEEIQSFKDDMIDKISEMKKSHEKEFESVKTALRNEIYNIILCEGLKSDGNEEIKKTINGDYAVDFIMTK